MSSQVQVRATEEIAESNFMGKRRHVHARKGDIGSIVAVDDEGDPMVRFHRTGTAITVVLGENAELAPGSYE